MKVNGLKTTILLAALTGLMLLIGSSLGGTQGMIIAFAFAIFMNLGAWWFSDSIALRLSGAKEANPGEMPELHNLLSRLAERAELPTPRLYIIESDMPNAFATGRSPAKGAVALTTGIINLLNRNELAGVIAHELAHIKHRDTLISSVTATIAGAITMLADMAMWAAMFGGFASDDEEGQGNVVGSLFMIILAPIAALLIQMAISRSREFSADEGGARILGDPDSLANALEKLEYLHNSANQPSQVNPAAAHLYIVNPLRGGFGSLFRTHPPTVERVARLRAMSLSASRYLSPVEA